MIPSSPSFGFRIGIERGSPTLQTASTRIAPSTTRATQEEVQQDAAVILGVAGGAGSGGFAAVDAATGWGDGGGFCARTGVAHARAHTKKAKTGRMGFVTA